MQKQALKSSHTSRFREDGDDLFVDFYPDHTAKIRYRGQQVVFNEALEIENYNKHKLPLPEPVLYDALQLSAQAYLDLGEPTKWVDRVKKARVLIDSSRAPGQSVGCML